MELENGQSEKIHGVEKAQWVALFRKFQSIVKMNPWKWLGKGDFFAIGVNSTVEPVFIHFHESDTAQDPGLTMVFGWNGEALFNCVVGGIDHSAMRSFEILLVRAFLRKKEDVTPVEREIFESTGLSPDADGRIPVFVCYRPSWLPWILGDRDAALCTDILNQVLGVLLRAETDTSIVRRGNPATVWIHSFDEKNRIWNDSWQNLRPLKEYAPGPKSMPKDSLIEKVRALPAKFESIEADMDVVPKIALINQDVMKRVNGGRVPIGYLLAVADASTAAKNVVCLGNCVFYPGNNIEAMWNTVPEALLKLFLAIGGRPREIAVSSHLMMNFLRPLQTKFRFKLTFHEKLLRYNAVLERTRAIVEETIAKGQPK